VLLFSTRVDWSTAVDGEKILKLHQRIVDLFNHGVERRKRYSRASGEEEPHFECIRRNVYVLIFISDCALKSMYADRAEQAADISRPGSGDIQKTNPPTSMISIIGST